MEEQNRTLRQIGTPTYYRSTIVGAEGNSYRFIEEGQAVDSVRQVIARELTNLRDRTGRDYFIEVYSS